MPNRQGHCEPLSEAAFARLMVAFDVQPARHVAVAVSGGADSLALALLLAAWARPRGIEVSALTVDHGLRPTSAAEALQVGDWLADQGIAHTILTWRHKTAVTTAVQARARDARYGLMAAWCRENGAGQLFVGHHLGDQAETFVMRLKRESTLFGLAGMACVRDVHGICVCRPLLDVAKASLEAALRARGQNWVEDPSNTNLAFERVRTRALIQHLHTEGVTAQRLAGAAKAAGRVTEILHRGVSAFVAAAVAPRSDGGLNVAGDTFMALPQVLRERAMSQLLTRVGGHDYAPSPDKIARLTKWLAVVDGTGKNVGGTARTLGGCIVRRTPVGFSIVVEPPRQCFQQVKKADLFTIAPLPRAVKGLTSQAYEGARACTKC